MTEFIGPDGLPMVPLRCDLCGEQIGLKTATGDRIWERENVVARCYACAATEEAEAITKKAS